MAKVIDAAQKEKVSILVITGDLFDSNRVSDILLDETIRELRRCRTNMVILPGNHDCLVPDGVYYRAKLEEAVPGLKVIYNDQGETLRFPALDLALWGKPICGYEADVKPMEGLPSRGKEKWGVALAHGLVMNDDYLSFCGYQISVNDLKASNRDYVALGHKEIFEVVSQEPPACYAGAPWRTGCVAMVELDEATGVRVRSHSLA